MSYNYKPKTAEQEREEDIKELKDFVRNCEAGLILASNPDTAMAVKIALGGNNSFELWIDNNNNIVELIEKEKRNAEIKIESLKQP